MPICYLLAILFLFTVSASADSQKAYQVIDVPPGQTVDTYFEINLSGYVFLNIGNKSGPACVDLWWITWPLGRIKEIGNTCGSVRLNIPGWLDLAIASKLRARGGNELIKIVASENSQVANTIRIEFP